MTDKDVNNPKEQETKEEVGGKEEGTASKRQKNRHTKHLAAGMILCALAAGALWHSQRDPLRSSEVTLETFESLPEHDVVVVDRSIAEYDDDMAAFIDEHAGTEGLHVYRNDDDETYALVSGKEGMEPLTLMLYGVVDGGEDSFVIGYNYVEASPLFRHEFPMMLLRIDAGADAEISGRIVQNDAYEPYQDILARYEEEGFEPMTPEERESLEEEAYQEMLEQEMSMDEDDLFEEEE